MKGIRRCWQYPNTISTALSFAHVSNPIHPLKLQQMNLEHQRQMASHNNHNHNNDGRRPIHPQRQMEHVQRRVSGPSLDVTVMSYNVLSDDLLWQHRDMYSNSPPACLNFERRKHEIIKTILYSDPTIACLQEVDASYFEGFYLRELRKHGYEGHFTKRTGDKVDGVAIFYKTDMFKLLECKKVSYYVGPDEVLDRDNVGLILSLQPLYYKQKRLPRRLCVANTHLLFNNKRGDVKLAQLTYLLAHLHSAAQVQGEPTGTYYPSFLCGDFNARPFYPLYNFIMSGRIAYSELDSLAISGQNRYVDRGKSYWISRNILPRFLTHESTLRVESSEPVAATSSGSGVDQLDRLQAEATKSPSTSGSKRSAVEHQDSAAQRKHSKTDLPTDPAGAAASTSADVTQQSCGEKAKTSWGTITHKFNFSSSYRHNCIERLQPYIWPEVTTQHGGNEGLTVDYIFYTGGARNSSGQNTSSRRAAAHDRSNLTLLSRYGLFSSYELEMAGDLPNFRDPSDHLPIVADFSLHK